VVKDQLDKVKSTQPKYLLRRDYLCLRLYYEQFCRDGDDEALSKKIDAFENYLERRTNLSTVKPSAVFLDFIKELKRLRKKPAQDMANERASLLDALNNAPVRPPGTDWLKKQIEQLP
jgi:hypothetical protein